VTPAEHFETAQMLLQMVDPTTTAEVLTVAQTHAILALAPAAVAEAADMHAEWV
jgi:hypothetical protein